MDINIKTFTQLTTQELYTLLQLRSEVFVMEQNCVYQDLDGKDQKALHVLGWDGEFLAAYTRLFAPSDYFKEASIGRVVVSPKARGKAYGHLIMKASLDALEEHFGKGPIHISAQQYLLEFYKQHGFVPVGEPYLEDDIPHMGMLRS